MAMTNFSVGVRLLVMTKERKGKDMCGKARLRNLKQDKGDGGRWPVDQGSDHCNFSCRLCNWKA